MHIALALTDTSIYSSQMNVHFELLDTSSAYYREVQHTFGAHRQHPLVKALNEALRNDLLRYVQNLKLAYNSHRVQHQFGSSTGLQQQCSRTFGLPDFPSPDFPIFEPTPLPCGERPGEGFSRLPSPDFQTFGLPDSH